MLHRLGGDLPAKLLAVHAQGVSPDGHRTAVESFDNPLCPVDHVPEVFAAPKERLCPARDVEAHQVCLEHPSHQLFGNRLRQPRELAWLGPRAMGEVGDADVGSTLAEHRRNQAEMEVMDEGLTSAVEMVVAADGEVSVHPAIGLPAPHACRVDGRYWIE